MNKVQQMIQQLCPEGVEFRKLGEVAEILDSQRKPVSKSKRNKGSYPYYGANGIQDYVDDYIFDGTFILMGEDGSVINKDKSPVLNWAQGKIWVNNHAHILSEKKEFAILRYIYYALSTKDVSSIVRGTPPKLNQQNLKAIEIPVPPLPIQSEIVSILDKFTQLEAELEAELDCRKRQYEHYRDKLLAFEGRDDVEWKKIQEISEVIAGGDVPKDSFSEVRDENYNIPIYSNGVGEKALYGFTESPRITSRSVTISARGTIGYPCLRTEPYYPIVRLICVIPDENVILSSYLRYYLETINFPVPLVGIPQLPVPIVKKILIPIPPLSEQHRLVSILDRFESLTTDISQGLPAEIAARRQQYEYYRNQLLSFNRKQA